MQRAYIEQVRGALHGFWYGFGKYDGYAIYEAPDNISIAGVVLAITAGGALASVETTALMTVEETLEASRRAGNWLPPPRRVTSDRERVLHTRIGGAERARHLREPRQPAQHESAHRRVDHSHRRLWQPHSPWLADARCPSQAPLREPGCCLFLPDRFGAVGEET